MYLICPGILYAVKYNIYDYDLCRFCFPWLPPERIFRRNRAVLLYEKSKVTNLLKNKAAIKGADVAIDVKKELKQSAAVEEMEKLLL